MLPLNKKRDETVKIECGCNGRMARCSACEGVGYVTKKSCNWCGGTGKDSIGGHKPCMQCRGQGYMSTDDIQDTVRFIQ